MVRLGRCEGVEPRDVVRRMGEVSRSMDEKMWSDGRWGELKALEELRESSDSERLRLRTIVTGLWVVGWLKKEDNGWRMD